MTNFFIFLCWIRVLVLVLSCLAISLSSFLPLFPCHFPSLHFTGPKRGNFYGRLFKSVKQRLLGSRLLFDVCSLKPVVCGILFFSDTSSLFYRFCYRLQYLHYLILFRDATYSWSSAAFMLISFIG